MYVKHTGNTAAYNLTMIHLIKNKTECTLRVLSLAKPQSVTVVDFFMWQDGSDPFYPGLERKQTNFLHICDTIIALK